MARNRQSLGVRVEKGQHLTSLTSVIVSLTSCGYFDCWLTMWPQSRCCLPLPPAYLQDWIYFIIFSSHAQGPPSAQLFVSTFPPAVIFSASHQHILSIPRMDEGGEEERAVQVHHLLHPSETQNPMCCDQTTKVTHLILVQSCLPATTAHQVLVQGSSLDSHLPFQKNVGAYGLWLTTAARFSWPPLFALPLCHNREI